jgi:thiol-disulfide isomerase/thioredoxin
LQLPDLAFEDAEGKPRKLSDWRGKTVLVNLWATWCVPCRKEMPALDSLQAKLGGKDFEVVAVNIDTRDPEKPKNFLKEANLTRLGYFADQKAKVFQDLKSVGKALGHADFGAGRRPGLRNRQPCRSCRMGRATTPSS